MNKKAILLVALFSGTMFVGAADVTWTTLSGTGDWNTAGNWDAGVPTSADDAYVTTDPTGTSYGVDLATAGTNEVFRLSAGVSDGNSLDFVINGSLSCLNTSTSDSDYGLNLAGNTTLTVADGGYLYVNAQATAGSQTNRIVIQEGGEIAYSQTTRRRFKFRGALDVYGKMNVLATNAQGIEDYEPATDRMNVYSTAEVDVSTIAAPLYVYNASNVICFGALELKHMTNSLVQYGRNYGGRYRTDGIKLGGGATANLYNTTVSPVDRGSVSSNYFNSEIYGLQLGLSAGGNAPSILNVYDNSMMELRGNILISDRPSAEVNLYSGSTIRTLTDVYCGSASGSYLSGATGTLNVEDGFFYATNVADNATMYIGNNNNGIVYVKDDGYLKANTVRIGCNTLSTGEFIINGGEVNISNGMIATNASLSTLTFNSGVLNVSGVDLTLGSALTVGDGADAATLGLSGALNSVDDGIIITNLSTLAVGGAGTVDDSVVLISDLVFAENSIIHCDLGNGTGDQLALTGDLRLPAVGSIELDAESFDDLPDVVDLITATTTSGETDLSSWTVESIGENKYRVSLEGNVLTLNRVLNGTCIIVR